MIHLFAVRILGKTNLENTPAKKINAQINLK